MPDLDLELAINKIQAQNRQVLTNLGIAPARGLAPDLSGYLPSIETGHLPYLITWVGAGRWNNKGHGWKTDHRTMMIIGFVEPLGQGLIPTRAQEAVQLLQALRSHYITAQNIPLTNVNTDGYQITVESGETIQHTDEGLQSNLEIGGRLYHGFTVSLQTRILWSTST